MIHRRLATSIASVALLGAWCAVAPAQSTRTALVDLDRETQDLYRRTQSHLVRVQVPVRVNTTHPLIKWRMPFDPKLRELLEGARASDGSQRLSIGPATTQASDGQPAEAQPNAASTAPPSTTQPSPIVVINVETVGVVLNERGDVLLPLFIDRAYVQQVQVTIDDRSATTATITAADRKTGLSIVRLAKPAGTPATFAANKPENGSLVLLLAQTRRAARLAIWTGDVPENAIIVNPTGEFAGIIRDGHALYPSTLTPIVEQLLTGGVVRRAKLGVAIADVAGDDRRRVETPALGGRSAVVVSEVLSDSAAARGGIQPNDMILTLAGEPVGDVATFAAAIANRRGRTELLVLREGAEKRVVVELMPE